MSQKKDKVQGALFALDEFANLNDNLAKLNPHQSFVYKLGLELAFSYTSNTQENLLPPDLTNSLQQKTACFQFEQIKCDLCDFHTESAQVLDKHLTEPHSTSKYICNFCKKNRFSCTSKEKFIEHMLKKHNRIPKLEKAFVSEEVMCPVCDYETTTGTVNPKLYDIDRTIMHKEKACPFREENIRNPDQSAIKLDYKLMMDNNLSPSKLDLLDYEFMFNVKPLDHFVNKYNLLCASLIKTNSILAIGAYNEENFNIQQSKILESLLQDSGINKPGPEIMPVPVQANKYKSQTIASLTQTTDKKESPVLTHVAPQNCQPIIKTAIPLTNTLKVVKLVPNLPLVPTSSINIPYQISKPLNEPNTNNEVKCFLCLQVFNSPIQQHSQRILALEQHLIAYHGIVNKDELNKLLEKQQNQTLNISIENTNKPIKVIKINQNLVLLRKTPSSQVSLPILTPILPKDSTIQTVQAEKRPIENETAENPSKKIALVTENTLNTSNNLMLDQKLKEIEAEKKFLFECLKLEKNESDLFELKGMPGKCCLCNSVEFKNILKHLRVAHKMDPVNSVKSLECLMCASKHRTRENLIKHQFNAHNFILFTSLNKIFTMDVDSTQETLKIRQEKVESKSEPENDCIILDSNTSSSEDSKKENINRSINLKKDSKQEEDSPSPSERRKRELKCLKCAKTYECFGDLLRHVKIEHQSLFNKKSKMFEFEKEEIEESKPIEVKEIEEEKKEEVRVKCEFCSDLTFGNKIAYEQHLIKNHLKKCQIKIERLQDNLDPLKDSSSNERALRRSTRNRKSLV